jgi:hypothetical protein
MCLFHSFHPRNYPTQIQLLFYQRNSRKSVILLFIEINMITGCPNRLDIFFCIQIKLSSAMTINKTAPAAYFAAE